MENKTCEVCGRTLTGKQTRACSIRCRNSIAGQVSVKRYKPIDRDWLAHQYLLPPDGLGRSTNDIGSELGFTGTRIQQVVSEYGLRQDTSMRLRYFRKTQPSRKLKCPDVSLLARLYAMPPYGEGITCEQIATEMNVSRTLVDRWLRDEGLQDGFGERHSKRMSGEGNPAYCGGNSQGYVRRRMAKRSPKICGWCGDTETKNICVHHIDHDRGNNTDDNLMWLCRKCNTLEGQMWPLQQSGRMTVEHTRNKIVLIFTEA